MLPCLGGGLQGNLLPGPLLPEGGLAVPGEVPLDVDGGLACTGGALLVPPPLGMPLDEALTAPLPAGVLGLPEDCAVTVALGEGSGTGEGLLAGRGDGTGGACSGLGFGAAGSGWHIHQCSLLRRAGHREQSEGSAA